MVKTNEADDRPPNQTPIPSAPREVSPEQLQGILENHAKWRESGGREGLRADLQDAVLIRRELQGVNLSGALLQRATLQ
jgi:uncharacterized protein YjbI with pentapeptide repeats